MGRGQKHASSNCRVQNVEMSRNETQCVSDTNKIRKLLLLFEPPVSFSLARLHFIAFGEAMQCAFVTHFCNLIPCENLAVSKTIENNRTCIFQTKTIRFALNGPRRGHRT